MLIEELQKRGMADRRAILDEESRAKAAIAKARAEGLTYAPQGRSTGSGTLKNNAVTFLTEEEAQEAEEEHGVSEDKNGSSTSTSKYNPGDLKGAISYHHRVLELSQEMQDFTGDSDALGTIADLYTELGDLETAARA
eukprot:jgi/Pico_ML_1/52754/g3417.t1